MPWVKIDDGFTDHPKIDRLSDRAFRLHIAAMCYSGRTLSDGFIPAGRERMLINGFRRPALQELVNAGLWDVEERGHRLHDFLDYNPSAEQVKSDRAYARLRKELFNNPQVASDIRARDGDRCRYCAVAVVWRDRRGARGATYDHVIPRGPNSLENVVVACRSCNSRKGNRTPEEAGMTLLPPSSGTGSDQDTRPDPSRPEGSRDGSTSSPLAVVSSPAPSGGDDTALPAEQVELNVSNIRAARERLREQAS